MKTCKNCDLQYDDGKKFCKKCGAPLEAEVKIESKAEAKKQVLEEKLKADPLNVTLLHEYLNFLIKQAIYNEALKTALKILAINESDNIAQDKLFNLYQKLQMHKEAIEAGEQILARKQNDVLLLESLLELSSKMNDDVRILQYSERLLSIDKNNPKGLYQKGLRLLEDLQLSDASTIFEKLTSEGNNDRIALIYSAISKVSNENFEIARQALSKVLSSEDIQPNDLDNNRGFLYLAYCLCKLDESIEEIDKWFHKIDFQVLNEEHTGQDEMVAAKTIKELFRKIFAGETINYSTVHRIKLLAHQYFDSNSFYFTELTKVILADIWLLVGEKQLKFKLHKDAFESLEKSIALNSSDLQIIESQAAFKSRVEAIRKKKMKKNIIILVTVIIIIAVGIAGILYRQYSNQDKEFAKAKTLNTYESFEQYLAFYPDGRYVNEAKDLQENAFWEQAQELHTYVSYQQYLKHYPKGKFKAEVVAIQDEAYWNKVKSYNDVDSLNTYIKSNPQGKYVNEAHKIIGQKGIIEKQEKQENQRKREKEIIERQQRDRENAEKQKIIEKEIAEKMKEKEKELMSKIRHNHGDYVDGDVYVNDGRSKKTSFKGKKDVYIMHPKSNRNPAYIEIECFIPNNGVKVIGEYASCNYDPINKKNKTNSNNDFVARIVVVDENNMRYVLNEEVVSYNQGWISTELSLNDFVGRIIRIRFENSAGGKSTWYFEFSAVAAFYIYSSNN